VQAPEKEPLCPLQDMTALSYLNEPGVLWNLNCRYMLDAIYTYTGSILIAVNPFASLPHMYGAHMMEQYKGRALGELSPHVYAIADSAYKQMRKDSKSQSILVRLSALQSKDPHSNAVVPQTALGFGVLLISCLSHARCVRISNRYIHQATVATRTGRAFSNGMRSRGHATLNWVVKSEALPRLTAHALARIRRGGGLSAMAPAFEITLVKLLHLYSLLPGGPPPPPPPLLTAQ